VAPFKSTHPVPAAWLRDSDLAAFVPAYVRRLVDPHCAATREPQDLTRGDSNQQKADNLLATKPGSSICC